SSQIRDSISNFFFIQSPSTSKKDLHWKNIIALSSVSMIVMTFVAFLKPEQDMRKFREVNDTRTLDREEEKKVAESSRTSAQEVWQNPPRFQAQSSGGQPNLNTPMLVGPGASNAHLQFNAGTKVRVKMSEKFMASDEPTPVIAVTIEDVQTEAGIMLPQGSQLYGEASHIKGSERAKIEFKQIAEPSGRIRQIQGLIVGLDGERGIKGKLHSDSLKNSTGQVLTTFVAGLAGGSVERDFMGQSKGGISNGLLNAVSETARDRASKYGESLKEAREWVEIHAGADAEVVLTQSLKMIESEVR
ncbi:MAG: TrbI/VirB10 family protein, partial [Bdellovibrionales bacterium]